ncbi:MAG: GIY-YIG nuclease family protein [Patescibacteria group bacterium]
MKYYVYILTSEFNGTLYIGVTNNLVKRVWEHKNKLLEGFTKKFNVSLLVYYEEYLDIRDAIEREKRMKKWNRQWKVNLIEKSNPSWNDLYDKIVN